MATVTGTMTIKASFVVYDVDAEDVKEAYSLAEQYARSDLEDMLEITNETDTHIEEFEIKSFTVEEVDPNINEDLREY